MTPFDQHNKRMKLKMTVYAEVLLDIIAMKGQSEVMEVIEVAIQHRVACLATLHRAIKWLEAEKFINRKVGDGDGRKRICTVAQRGMIFLKSF